jgi:tripartite-type tricarboxylate transporter receptor subunit TctC
VPFQVRSCDYLWVLCRATVRPLGAIAEQVRAGKLKALAVTGDRRAAALPDVPTIAEAGVPQLEVYSWQAVAAPKGLPADVKAKLEAELVASIKAPEVKARFDQIGFDVVGNSSAQFAQFQAAEIARWKQVIETGKITAE